MREIKFRAWSELDLKMNQCDMEDDIQDYFKHDDGITLMQYTGLKDKNGKEIYEGDIVESGKNKLKEKIVHRAGHGSSNWFDESGFCIPVNCEVIGNIHQNPELLK